MKRLTPTQYKLLREAGVQSEPLDLNRETGAERSFVYLRAYGLFLCDTCSHESVRSLLWSFSKGYDCDVYHLGANTLKALGLANRYDAGDKFYDLPGAACKSSCSTALSYKYQNMEQWELDYMANWLPTRLTRLHQ